MVALDTRVTDYLLGEHTQRYDGYRLQREAQEYGVPLGLTWAVALETDRDNRDQPARERANSLWLERHLEEQKDLGDDDVMVIANVWAFRVLNVDGTTAKWAAEIAEAISGLDDYPVISDDVSNEVEWLYFDEDWQEGVIDEIEREAPLYGRREGKVYVMEPEDLPEGWEDTLFEKYRAPESEWDYDDRGYATPSIDTAIQAIRELGWERADDD